MATSLTQTMSPVRAQLNDLWKALLRQYPDGVSNTSTTKYNDIRVLLSTVLGVSDREIYATGAKTRTSNLDTRLVQGNQAGRHTDIGAAFLQVDNVDVDFDRLSDSAVVTARKFVDGSDITQYKCILIFVERKQKLLLTRVIQGPDDGYFDLLKTHYPETVLIEVGRAPRQSPPGLSTTGREAMSTGKLPNIVESFVASANAAHLIFQPAMVRRFTASLLAKKFVILSGLAGSGKTKLAQAFARWITPTRMTGDIFAPGSKIESDRITYFVKKVDALSVEFWNDEKSEQATKVTLPREMITEWANYIKTHSLPNTTTAREIREGVKGSSKFSDQLHSFETHLKAAAFAMVNSRSDDAHQNCYALVPVGADWTGNESILGYPDGLQPTTYITKPALDLIRHAADHADIPHFLILDEMNLSHVERYFADILSIIESDEGLVLYSGDERQPDTWRQTTSLKRVPPKLERLPENLFIIGTVNVDETTYMFSPKVLDRANVIEFSMDAHELVAFFGNPATPDLSKLDGKGASFGTAFLDAAKNSVAVPVDVKAAYDAEMLVFFKTLQGHGAEFGYRTAYEAARFIHFYKLLGNHVDGDTTWFPRAFDCVVFQKLLPKLHGSRAKLGPLLKKLWFLCVSDADGRGAAAIEAAKAAARSTDTQVEPSVVIAASAPYPQSAEKIARMWRLLKENGFASFAEA